MCVFILYGTKVHLCFLILLLQRPRLPICFHYDKNVKFILEKIFLRMLKRLASTFQSGLNTAVAATRDGVNRALPGNPALRDYEISDQTGTGGAHGLWDIYNAVKEDKRSNYRLKFFLDEI